MEYPLTPRVNWPIILVLATALGLWGVIILAIMLVAGALS